MDRRTFLTLASGLLAAPLAAEAQPGRVYRIGATVASDIYYMAFEQGLRDAGWAPGQNPRIERRSVGGARDRVAGMVSEIVALKVDVILATAPWTIRTFRKATSTIPIVGLDLESDRSLEEISRASSSICQSSAASSSSCSRKPFPASCEWACCGSRASGSPSSEQPRRRRAWSASP